MNKVKLSAIVTTSAVLLLAAAILVSPPAEGGTFADNVAFSQLVIIGLVHILAAVLLLASLKGFQRRFKRAYLWLSASFIGLAIGMIQYPIIGVLDAFDSAYVLYGFGDLPFLFVSIFAYIGVVMIARTVNVKSMLLSPWVAFGLAVAAAAVAFFAIPSSRVDIEPLQLSLTLGLYTFEAVIVIVEAIILRKTIATAGNAYKSAIKWYFASVLFVVLGGVGYVFSQALIPFDHIYNAYSLGTLPYVFSSLLLIRAAVAFNQLAYAERLLIKQGTAAKGKSSVDIVTTLADLASNPSDIDPMLENLRVMTAAGQQGYTLSEQQQRVTADTYKKLVDYLITKEPARKFTAEQLNEMIEIRFKGSVAEPAFWQTIQARSTAAPAPAIR